jgi:hypothetical protein
MNNNPCIHQIDCYITTASFWLVSLARSCLKATGTLVAVDTEFTYIHLSCLRMNECSFISEKESIDRMTHHKRYSKHYRHNVKSSYECFMDQNGVHSYWNNIVFECHWPSTSDIKTLVCSKYLRKIYSVSVTVLLHTE